MAFEHEIRTRTVIISWRRRRHRSVGWMHRSPRPSTTHFRSSSVPPPATITNRGRFSATCLPVETAGCTATSAGHQPSVGGDKTRRPRWQKIWNGGLRLRSCRRPNGGGVRDMRKWRATGYFQFNPQSKIVISQPSDESNLTWSYRHRTQTVAHVYERETDRPTDRPRCSICNNMPHPRILRCA